MSDRQKLMASSSGEDDDLVVLVCTDPTPTRTHVSNEETRISTSEISSWDFPNILCFQTLKIEVDRSRLIEQSSYFRGLFARSFSESYLDRVSIEWNVETFLNVLKCMYGCPFDINSKNFLNLFEASLYFGVEKLLLLCQSWFSEVSSSADPELLDMQLDDFICIWNFGIEHANDVLQGRCASYLARNFMRAMSTRYFGDLPYDLLLLSVKHSNLTIESEIYLAQAVLIWFEANKVAFGDSHKENVYHEILKEVQFNLLPLWFTLGKTQGSGNLIYEEMGATQVAMDNVLAHGGLSYPRIRLSEYLKKVDLAGCLQITSITLLESVVCRAHGTDDTLGKRIKQSISSLQRGILPEFPPILSFEAMRELDISKCLNLDLEASIELFSKSFPFLRTVKAAHLLNFELHTFFSLIQKFPMLCNVDLSIDLSPLIPAYVSVISSSQVNLSRPKRPFIVADRFSLLMRSPDVDAPLANITKLTLEGRDDFDDSDLQHLSKLSCSLQYLNLNGCTSVSDIGIANLIHCCRKLDSILVCYTSFGHKSVGAIFLGKHGSGASLTEFLGDKNWDSLASNLQMLHIRGCKGVDEAYLQELLSQTQMLKSLSLGDTHLVDDALYNFSGSCLEMLDVSNTAISAAALSDILHRNPCLKWLNARGCKYLFQLEKATAVTKSSPYPCEELWIHLGKQCRLEEISVGWGFTYFSLEALKPAATLLEAITVGLGGSLAENALELLPTTCPLLKSLTLHFQVISDVIMMNIVKSLRNLERLALCYCLGDISISSFMIFMPNLRKLKLERVTPWMTNNDLVILTQNCRNVVDLSLLGCSLLTSDSQQIISQGWPGLISLHLEECGEVTKNGLYSLTNCSALEDLVLRHNGPGLPRNFIPDFASRMPLLRQISIDLCDAGDGDFDIPDCTDSFILRTVKIARCKTREQNPSFTCVGARRGSVHKETLVLVWRNTTLVRAVVKERI